MRDTLSLHVSEGPLSVSEPRPAVLCCGGGGEELFSDSRHERNVYPLLHHSNLELLFETPAVCNPTSVSYTCREFLYIEHRHLLGQEHHMVRIWWENV